MIIYRRGWIVKPRGVFFCARRESYQRRRCAPQQKKKGVGRMNPSRLRLRLACAVCAGAAVLFALLCFVLPQGRTLLICLCAVFVLLLSLNVHALHQRRMEN